MACAFQSQVAPLWKNVAENHSVMQSIDLYLAGEHTVKNGSLADWKDLNILESFYYARKNKYVPKLLPYARNFMLDSGAFTFMQSGEKLDWDMYVNEYCDFINQNDIKLFFELDIDSIVGLSYVEKMRATIERRTGKKPIPVWHVERGKQYFIDMCKEYDYVALGSIAKVKAGKIRITEEYFPWFVQTAKENGAKIHALGYTPKDIKHSGFTSVDSTAWVYGNMKGCVYKFDPIQGEIKTYKRPQGTRLNARLGAVNNFNEYVKYMMYLRNIN